MKFIHAADLHIDSPLRGLDSYEGAPVARLRGASRHALTALVDLALGEDVAFVLLAGDIYDGNWADFRTGLFFRDQMLRLARAGIRVFIVKGNHDAESQITKQLPEVEGVHVFSAAKSETVELEALGVAVHGRSFPHRAVPEDLVPLYPAPLPGRFNIGVLHTSLTGRAGHDPYAPTSVDVLCDKGYDYFALGHVHAREVVREAAPRIVFPGNLQGRHVGETGPKGCELVTVEGGRIVEAVFVGLEVVRWHQMAVDATGLASVDALCRQVVRQAHELFRAASDRLHAVRVRVVGETDLHRVEAEQPGTIAAAIQAATQDLDGIDVWIEQVELAMRSPLDRGAAAARTDALGEVVRLVDGLGGPDADEAALRAWFLQQVGDMKDLPGAMLDAAPAAIDTASMRALLADAEATVLAQLSGLAGNAGEGARA
jgi:exonuclease SbcD